MTAKILAGLLAAILVAGVGVYVAFSDGSTDEKPTCRGLAVSEGACPAQKAKLACCEDDGCPYQAEAATCSRDAVAACAGSAALATSPKICAKVGCCDD
jgi:hypothetical protein